MKPLSPGTLLRSMIPFQPAMFIMVIETQDPDPDFFAGVVLLSLNDRYKPGYVGYGWEAADFEVTSWAEMYRLLRIMEE